MNSNIIFLGFLALFAFADAGRHKNRKNNPWRQLKHADARPCIRQTCWAMEECYPEACVECKTKCLKGDGSMDRACLKTSGCKKQCKKFKNMPKECKMCRKECLRTSINSDVVQSWLNECKDNCDEVCWGPRWKSADCNSCRVENCEDNGPNED